MKYLLVFSSNWADEFDCEQLRIVDTREQAEEIVEKLNNMDDTDEIYFGTNEGFYGEELFDSVSIKEITDEQAEFLKDTLNISSYRGTFGTGILGSVN
tara:strand:+ start:10937 stop:11230 length:294 start_codon:yes stop_codon:yes gene_type:complete